MKTDMFAIHDNLCGYFTPPFFAINSADAQRSVSHLVNSGSDIPVCKSPSDFTLYVLGSYDDSSASFELHPQPLAIINCGQLININQSDENHEK